MLVTLSLEASEQVPDATDLGHLLHKHPDRVQSFDLAVGTAHVFYPEARPERCTAALLLSVDPIVLARGKRGQTDAFTLGQYVNDRPYAAGSLLAVALGRVFTTAMRGELKSNPDLPKVALPLTIRIPAVPSTPARVEGGPDLARRFFEPLGWVVESTRLELDPQVARWGDSPYVDLCLTGRMRLADALTQLYVLLPALAGAKHYWVAGDEVDKLIAKGGDWLAAHPEREVILRRALAGQRQHVADAMERLAALDDSPVDTNTNLDPGAAESTPADTAIATRPLVALRKEAVVQALTDVGAARVVDLGCGEGALIQELLKLPRFTEIVGIDVSAGELERAARRLNLDRMPDSQRARLTLAQGSVTYRDARLSGHDAIVLMEVIEHLDLDRLPSLERTVFGSARPGAVIVTTPNAEHNALFESLPAGDVRHPDHRFEWTRAEFAAWAQRVGAAYGYTVEFRPVGVDDETHGPPTQMALFRRGESGEQHG